MSMSIKIEQPKNLNRSRAFAGGRAGREIEKLTDRERERAEQTRVAQQAIGNKQGSKKQNL